MTQDTICAVISPLGTGAVSALRISGPQALQIVAKHFSKSQKLLAAPANSVIHGSFSDPQGKLLDEVLLTKFTAPHSYTGEDVVELSCHGNPNIVSHILQTLLLSCRIANPGEFTLRAYLNGKLDLIQAEAVNDLIHAKSSKSAVSALQQLQGQLTKHLAEILAAIQNARLRVELAIDFSDQDLPQIDIDRLGQDINKLLEQAQSLYQESQNGKYLRDGITICLAGAPNVGKSSLFNAFLKENRAIVSPHPGTTRDYLEESVSLFGYTVVIYDTAGLHETSDEIESIGIERTHALIQSSDLVLELMSLDEFLQDSQTIPYAKTIQVVSKIDLLGFAKMPSEAEWLSFLKSHGFESERISPIPVSTVLEGGLKSLRESILSVLKLPLDLGERPLITNSRQLAALGKSIESLLRTQAALEQELGFEYVAFDLIEASGALQEILGTISTDDMLEEIFSNFCVGK